MVNINESVSDFQSFKPKEISNVDKANQSDPVSKVAREPIEKLKMDAPANSLDRRTVMLARAMGALMRFIGGPTKAKMGQLTTGKGAEQAKKKVKNQTLEAVIQKVLLGDRGVSALLIHGHRNNENTRDLFGMLTRTLTNYQGDEKEKNLALGNALKLGVLYLSEGTSLPLGGAERDVIKQQLIGLAAMGESSSDERVKELGEALKGAADTIKPPIPLRSLRAMDTALANLKRDPSATNIQAAANLVRQVEIASQGARLPQKAEELQGRLAAIANPVGGTQFAYSIDNSTAEEFYQQASRSLRETYLRISPSEMDALAWASKPPVKFEKAPNLLNHIKRTTDLSRMIQHQIIHSKDPKQAAEKIIDAAALAAKEHNYDLAMALMSALNASPVYRMNAVVWNELGANHTKKLAALNSLLNPDRSYKALRKAISDAEGKGKPVQPYVGMMLTDLTFTFEGNPDTVRAPAKRKGGAEGPDLVNLNKIRSMSNAKQKIANSQAALRRKTATQDVDPKFASSLGLVSYSNAVTDDALYLKSRERSPKVDRKT